MNARRWIGVVSVAVFLVLAVGWPGGQAEVADEPSSTGTIWEDTEPPALGAVPQATVRAALEPYRQQARQAQADSQWDLAARRFLDLAGRVPEGGYKQNLLMAGGECLAQAGRTQEAIAKYDEVVAIGSRLLAPAPADEGEAGAPRLWRSGRITIKDHLQRALEAKALVCHRAGDSANALQAMACLRAWSPGYDNLRRVLPIQAEIEGTDAASLMAAEAAASALARQAQNAWAQGQLDQALQLADGAIGQYPAMAGTLQARRLKADLLWRHRRQQEAREVYGEILAAVGAAAPDSSLVQSADRRVAFFDAGQLYKRLALRSVEEGPGTVPEADWQQLRSLCTRALRTETQRVDAAHMRGLIVESFSRQDRPEDTIAAADEMLRRCEPGVAPEIQRLRMIAQGYAADALARLGRHAEAIDRLRIIVQAGASDPAGWAPHWPLACAHFALWWELKSHGGSPEEMEKIADSLIRNAPQSVYAYRIAMSR